MNSTPFIDELHSQNRPFPTGCITLFTKYTFSSGILPIQLGCAIADQSFGKIVNSFERVAKRNVKSVAIDFEHPPTVLEKPVEFEINLA